MAIPQTTKAWIVDGKTGIDCLKFEANRPIPALGDHEVLVKIEGVSLNYRDLIIPRGKYGFPQGDKFVACSDGAGTVVATGKSAHRHKVGDRVLTLFNTGHQGGSLDAHSVATGLGGSIDGTLREYGAFDETALVTAPTNLSSVEASTLSCAGLTAWNALFGLTGRQLKQGDWVLTQGTGGVSIFAVQFAKAAGARVVATTGSDHKAALLKKLGADVIINYKTTPEWGAEAKKASGGHGMDHVVEVAGPTSMQQSLNSVAIDGVISIIGFVGGGTKEKEPTFLQCLTNICTVRGLLVGSRVQLEEMCRAVEANESLRPVLDPKVFDGIESAKDAYEYMWNQQHTAKVTIKI